MIKKEFIELYASQHNIDVEIARDEVEKVLETLKLALSKDNSLTLRNFGNFEVKTTKERDIIDPKDSENILQAKPRKYIKFKTSKALEEFLSEEQEEQL